MLFVQGKLENFFVGKQAKYRQMWQLCESLTCVEKNVTNQPSA